MNLRMWYGDLELTDSPFGIEFDGTDYGSPEAVVSAMAFLLDDGEVEVTTRRSNRTLSFSVIVEGSDMVDLADAEKALAAQAEKPRNTLTIDPGDGFGAPFVFETFQGSMVLDRSESMEMALMRRYVVTLRAEPFARSADQFTVVGATVSDPAPTPPPPTTITDGVSGTNWTVHTAKPTTYGGVAFSTNPILQLGYNKAGVQTEHVYEYEAGISVGQQKYLALDWQINGPAAYMTDISPSLAVNNVPGSPTGGIKLTRVAQMASPTNPGYTRTLWAIPSSVPSILRMRFTASMNKRASDINTVSSWPRGFAIRLVQLTSQPLYSGTTRQKTMAVAVPGSAPMVGSLQVSHPSTALGDLLVYSWADSGCGYSPAMRKFRTSGGTLTPDASTYSGASEPLSSSTAGALIYDVPTSQLPAGLYVLYARLKRAAAGATTIQVDSETRPLGGGQPLPGSTPVTVRQMVTLSTGYDIVPIGRMMLPTVDAGANGQAHITVSNPGDGTVTLDELYLCNATIGRTTLVNARLYGATPVPGGAPSTVWINSPTTDSPRPSVTAGVATDGSDAYNIESLVSSSQPHRWEPPSVSVFTACNALDATTTLTGFARWHTHAADDQAA